MRAIFDKYMSYPVDSLIHLPEISSYNWNYYRTKEDQLLCGVSDDVDQTTWYLVKGEGALLLGCSFPETVERIYTDKCYRES